MMAWRIRAVFDLLFMMCHLIASISPYLTVLVPHITVEGERGCTQKEGKKERKNGGVVAVMVGPRWENPMNPIYTTDDREKRTGERKR